MHSTRQRERMPEETLRLSRSGGGRAAVWLLSTCPFPSQPCRGSGPSAMLPCLGLPARHCGWWRSQLRVPHFLSRTRPIIHILPSHACPWVVTLPSSRLSLPTSGTKVLNDLEHFKIHTQRTGKGAAMTGAQCHMSYFWKVPETFLCLTFLFSLS